MRCEKKNMGFYFWAFGFAGLRELNASGECLQWLMVPGHQAMVSVSNSGVDTCGIDPQVGLYAAQSKQTMSNESS